MCCIALPVSITKSPTTLAVTGTARSARPVRQTLARSPAGRSVTGGVLPSLFTLPAPISAIAYTNKAMIYGLLFEVAAETLRTIAADPKHLGARIGATLVLHTWGSALTHHSACARHRPRRRVILRRRAMGGLQAGLLLIGTGAVTAVSTAFSGRAQQSAGDWTIAVLR